MPPTPTSAACRSSCPAGKVIHVRHQRQLHALPPAGGRNREATSRTAVAHALIGFADPVASALFRSLVSVKRQPNLRASVRVLSIVKSASALGRFVCSQVRSIRCRECKRHSCLLLCILRRASRRGPMGAVPYSKTRWEPIRNLTVSHTAPNAETQRRCGSCSWARSCGWVRQIRACHTPEPVCRRRSRPAGNGRRRVQSRTGLPRTRPAAFRLVRKPLYL